MKNRRILKHSKRGQATYMSGPAVNQKSLLGVYEHERLFPRMSREGLHQRLAERYKGSEREKMMVSLRFPDVKISSSAAEGTRKIRCQIPPKSARRLASASFGPLV